MLTRHSKRPRPLGVGQSRRLPYAGALLLDRGRRGGRSAELVDAELVTPGGRPRTRRVGQFGVASLKRGRGMRPGEEDLAEWHPDHCVPDSSILGWKGRSWSPSRWKIQGRVERATRLQYAVGQVQQLAHGGANDDHRALPTGA